MKTEKLVLKTRELKLGDVVRLLGGNIGEPWQDQTVINVDGEKVTFFRPYMIVSSFSYTNGVIPYIGVEKYDVPLGNPSSYEWLGNIFQEDPKK